MSTVTVNKRLPNLYDCTAMRTCSSYYYQEIEPFFDTVDVEEASNELRYLRAARKVFHMSKR